MPVGAIRSEILNLRSTALGSPHDSGLRAVDRRRSFDCGPERSKATPTDSLPIVKAYGSDRVRLTSIGHNGSVTSNSEIRSDRAAELDRLFDYWKHIDDRLHSTLQLFAGAATLLTTLAGLQLVTK